jgi:hypothetical protein
MSFLILNLLFSFLPYLSPLTFCLLPTILAPGPSPLLPVQLFYQISLNLLIGRAIFPEHIMKP